MNRRQSRTAIPIVAGLVLLLSSCTAGASSRRVVDGTTTSTHPLAQTTAVGCPAIPTRPGPDPSRPRYTLTANIHPAEGTVDGNLRIAFTPDLDTDRLVFRLWPNGPRSSPSGTKLEAGPVSVSGRPAASNLDDPTTLVVRTGSMFRAGQPVDVALRWRLQVGGAVNDRISVDGGALRLGSFFPILPWEPGVGWDTDPPVAIFAEASTAPTADFDLTVTVPDGFDVLASGVPDPARRGHFTAVAMRDIAVSVGRFMTASRVAMAPQAVQVAVGVHHGLAASPEVYLDRAVRSLEEFARRFGPYPWPTFTLAITPGLDGGIEYPGHVMQGPDTLNLTSHEVAHQWFYGLVGNNQGRDPWLDEGLASWAEARFEGTLERFQAASIPPLARSRVGQPMIYWSMHGDIYTIGVYVQGTQALSALGDPDLVDCALRIYAAVNAYRIARPPDLIRALVAVFPDARTTLASYGVKG